MKVEELQRGDIFRTWGLAYYQFLTWEEDMLVCIDDAGKEFTVCPDELVEVIRDGERIFYNPDAEPEIEPWNLVPGMEILVNDIWMKVVDVSNCDDGVLVADGDRERWIGGRCVQDWRPKHVSPEYIEKYLEFWGS